MLVSRLRVSEKSVLIAALGAAAVVGVCGGLGLLGGVWWAVRRDRPTEGLVVAAMSTMIAAVSLAILLFVAWHVQSQHPPGDTSQHPPGDRSPIVTDHRSSEPEVVSR